MANRGGRGRYDGEREPSGRLKRESQKDIMAVATKGRERVYGLPAGHGSRPEATDLIGRMHLAGQVTRREFEAARRYQKVMADYSKAMESQGDASGVDLQRGAKGHDNADPFTDWDHIEWCERAVKTHDETVQCLRKASVAAELAVINVVETEVPQSLPAIKEGLQALADTYNIPLTGDDT